MNLVEAKVKGSGTMVEDLAFSVKKSHPAPCEGKEGRSGLGKWVDLGQSSSFFSVKQ